MKHNNFFRCISLVFSVISLVISISLGKMMAFFSWPLLGTLSTSCKAASVVLLGYGIVSFVVEYKFYKGLRYGWHYWSIRRSVEKQLKEAGFGSYPGRFLKLPKIHLSFSDGFQYAHLRIRASLENSQKLLHLDLSPALGDYIVLRQYLSADRNDIIIEAIDSRASFKLVFSSLKEFQDYCKSFTGYQLFLNSRTVVKLQSMLIAGITGGGKTYALYSFLMQLVYKKTKCHLYFVDPKGSSLSVFSKPISPKRTAVSLEETVALLTQFYEAMQERKKELEGLLKGKLDADYSDFGLEPYVFVIDEYTAVHDRLAQLDKKDRDKVVGVLHEIVLQGRQLGFFLFVVMQKSDSKTLETSIRDNLPLKLVVGNSEDQTYVTTFGQSAKIPPVELQPGDGFFTEPKVAREPKFVQLPSLSSELLEEFMRDMQANDDKSGHAA
mgnify:CR=1 FL=1